MSTKQQNKRFSLAALSSAFIVFFIGQQYIILRIPDSHGSLQDNFVIDFENDAEEINGINCDEHTNIEDKIGSTNSIYKHNGSFEGDRRSGFSHYPKEADGKFNSFPIYHEEVMDDWHSNVHCIGDNFSDDAWKYRSCHFQNLCFNMEDKEFVMFTSPQQLSLEQALQHSQLNNFSPASSMTTEVSLGGINPKWNNDAEVLKWWPKLLPSDDIKKNGFYSLHSDSVLVPFHSLAGFNPGHLVWDDFLAIYTLLATFGVLQKELVLIRMNVEPALWASCQRQIGKCKPILTKFIPLMGLTSDKLSTQNDTVIEIKGEKKSNFICSPNGAAGLGMLTDHGTKLHGWRPKDYETSHNTGRGGSLYDFRNWIMQNVGMNPEEKKIHNSPYRIVISKSSSKQSNRNYSFDDQYSLLNLKLGEKYDLDIRQVKLSSMTIKEQIGLISGASIFITMCGGGAVSAIFLPQGAAVFAYFLEGDGDGGTPARLDWDLFNNMGYLRTHWLPRPKTSRTRRGKLMDGPGSHDHNAFLKLIEHELDVISHTSDY